MWLKIQLICCLAMLAKAQNSIEQQPAEQFSNDAALLFETSHKRPIGDGERDFQTSHKIPRRHALFAETDLELLQGTMNLLPTKERPELDPVLSALINEDVMKSIEAKRAIEEEELEQIKAELEAKRKLEAAEEEAAAKKLTENDQPHAAAYAVLTTAAPPNKHVALDDDFNAGFVDQAISLDTAGSESNKKSRIEIKKGPNGQDYEYEYVYYYEDEDDANAKPASEPADKVETNERGKSRYSNIERTTATPTGNSLVSNKAKGRSSSVVESNGDEVEAERLPANTRFPSRGKSAEAQPTPALDSLENAAEKKKISVKRPSLELVDSATFNTDEKQVKGIRNGDTETKSAIVIEQEQAAAAAAEKKEADEKQQRRQPTIGSAEESATVKDVAEDADVEQTTLSMQKSALDLYAILANENLNMDMTTDADADADAGVTTIVPDTANPDEAAVTTLMEEQPSSTTTTSTTTTTTTEPTTTTTTTESTPAPTQSLYGGKRPGLNGGGRNRFKLNKGGKGEATSTTTTEAQPSEAPKAGKNRFSRPSIGGRTRPGARTTTTAAPATGEVEEEVAAPKEAKPVSTGFGRGRPRNRFNLRSTTTTEKAASADGADAAGGEDAVSSTTVRSLRGGRPQLNLRGRSRTTTPKPAAGADEEHKDEEATAAAANAVDEKAVAATPAKPPSRFARPGGGNRLLPRGKLARTTEAPTATSDDSTADSSHHSDIKGGEAEGGEENAEKAAGAAEGKHSTALGLNRLKSRPTLHKTDNNAAKTKVAPAPVAPRKVNPLLAKRRLALGHSTTETPSDEDNSTAAEETKTEEESAPAGVSADASASADNADSAETETTTKPQARGLGLLTQRRRLPLRKPGTIL